MMSPQASLTTPTTTKGLTTPAPKIEVTTTYGQFRLMSGNRAIDYNHVKRLKREMEANPELLASSPILVNEHMFIIDGQHRKQAAQELGVALYYIVVPGIDIQATRHLNTTQMRWQLLDFARSYADSGRQDYVTFLRLHTEFPQIIPSILRLYLAGGYKGDVEVDFRRGEFQILNMDEARSNLERLAEIIGKTYTKMNTPMAMALLQQFNNSEFKYATFMSKLEREPARELFQPTSAIRGCLRSIENVYNFQSKFQTRLY